MRSERKRSTKGRRDFLKLAGVGAVAAGMSAVGGKAEAGTAGEARGSGYRVTEHVRKVYELARF